MNRIKDPDSYQIQDRGHFILSTYWSDFNKILVSEKFRNHEIDGYMNSAPGLNDIIFKADEYLSMFSSEELDQINDDLSKLKNIYQNLEYDPGFLSSIMENAAKMISPPVPISVNSDEIFNKNTIFISAQDRIKSTVQWSTNFPRKEKKEVVKDITTQETRITPAMKSIVRLSNVKEEKISENIEPTQNQEEKFVLKSLKHRKVESKTLPNPPQGDIEKILLYMKSLIEEDFEMVAIGKAFELARDNIRKIILQSDYMWDMSTYAYMYQRKKPNLSLNERDRSELLEKIEGWIFDLKEEERLEQERLENIRKEKERIEREKELLDKKEKQLEQERLENIRKEKERIEREKELLDKKQREFESMDPKQKKKLEKEQKKLQKRKEKERKKLEKERKKLEKKKLKDQKKKK
jgi:hypothetical protein